MDKFVVNFGTAEPFRFTEPKTNEEYEARINGKAFVNEYDTSKYASEDDVIKAVRSNVKDITEDSLKYWPADDIMHSNKESLLNSFLSAAYEKMGIKADFAVNTFMLTEESQRKWKDSRITALSSGQPKLSDLTPEEHGPLVEIVSDHSYHGMAMGSGTYTRLVLVWQDDGCVLIEITDKRDGKESYDKHIAGSEAADKLRVYVRESHVAEMAQVKPIPFPYTVTDVSSSAYMTFTFDDGKDGMAVHVDRRLDCGSYWQLQSQTIQKIRELIRECIDTGKRLEHKENSYDPRKPVMTGFMGMGMIQSIEAWKCDCGTDNTGKYCVNCGKKNPSDKWKCPNCNEENEGKFCSYCATPRP